MISEGSCDTEDWSNDAENSAFCNINEHIHKLYAVFMKSLLLKEDSGAK